MIKAINNKNLLLAECPIWNKKEKSLYWTDILGKCIWRFDPQTSQVEIAWQGNQMIGGFAFNLDNDIVACTEKGVFKIKKINHSFLNGSLEKLFEIPMENDERFNDITTDPMGRIWAGTLKKGNFGGVLYRLEKGKEPVRVLQNLGISNGMTFSLAKNYFYHTDSSDGVITRYEYNLKTGDICEPQLFYRANDEDGTPDGITMDRDGNIWAACWGGAQVICINSDGNITRRIKVPAQQVSSVIFGGSPMNTLFITTAAIGSVNVDDGLDESGAYLGGKVYYSQLSVKGRDEWLCNI
jgi:sugar lactone lactonase YvrE